MEIDSDLMIWVKNYDQIMIIDVRDINKTGQVHIIRSIELNNKYIKTYNYTITVVEDEPAMKLFAKQ